MPKALVIGGDRIEGIRHVLHAQGIDSVDHWTGRKPSDVRRDLPQHLTMIVVVTGWLNHSMMYHIKHLAQKRGLRILYVRHGADLLQHKLQAAA